MPAAASPGPDGAQLRRFVEHYESTIQLSATAVVRSADGWELLSAGRVDDSTFWAEYERVHPGVPGQETPSTG